MEGRPHAAYAVYTAAQFWAVWLLPLLRLLTVPLGGDIRAIRYDAVPVLLVCAWAFLRWRCCRYRVEETAGGVFHRLCIRQGVAVCRRLHLCADDAASVEVERTPLLWLLRCRRIRISTAGLRRRTDAVLYLTASHTRRLFSLGSRPRRFRGRWLSTLMLAVSGSNAAVGVLTLVPLFRQAGRVFGLPQSAAENPFLRGLPPLFRMAANLLLLGWGAAVCLSYFRYLGFSAVTDEGTLHLTLGVLTRRDLLIDRRKITGLQLRQTLLMRVFGLYGASITAAGYGRKLGMRPVLVPAAPARELNGELVRLLPDYPRAKTTVRAVSQWRYVWAPLLWLAAGAVITLFWGLWRPLSLLWSFVGSWWLLIRLVGQAQAGVGCSKAGITLSYPYGLALYRVHLPSEVTDRITVTQSPWERCRGTCTVQVYTFGEKRRRHRVTGLPYRAVGALFKM